MRQSSVAVKLVLRGEGTGWRQWCQGGLGEWDSGVRRSRCIGCTCQQRLHARSTTMTSTESMRTEKQETGKKSYATGYQQTRATRAPGHIKVVRGEGGDDGERRQRSLHQVGMHPHAAYLRPQVQQQLFLLALDSARPLLTRTSTHPPEGGDVGLAPPRERDIEPGRPRRRGRVRRRGRGGGERRTRR